MEDRLKILIPVLRKVAMGDFSEKLAVPEKEDEFTEFLVALNIMIDDLQELTGNLEKKVAEKTVQLEAALDESKQRNQRLIDTKKNMGKVMQEVMTLKAKDEALLNSIAECMLAVDKNKNVIALNERAENFLEIKSEKIIGKSYHNVCKLMDSSGKILKPEECPFEQVILSGNKFKTNDYFYVRADDTKIPISISLAPIINDEILGAIAIFRDITREKEIEKAKNEFISLVSHQLRSPLVSLKWYADMLLDSEAEPLSQTQKNYVEEIDAAGHRMDETVNLILNVSRIELGTFQINPILGDPCKIIDGVLKEFDQNIQNKNLNIIRDCVCDKHEVLVDVKILEIVVQNLVSNAVKYTPVNGQINLDLEASKPKELLIKVSDTGCGIPKVDQPKIFTKIFRATNANKADPNGNGLGLYLIKSVLNRVGGKIWFESVENKGSTFYATIPIRR